jgi:hypothetical protein
VVRARGRHESATVFLPAVRPLLALAAEVEAERNHVIPPPEPGSDLLDGLDLMAPEPGAADGYEALESDAEFAHVLHGGRAVLGDGPITAEDEDYLGLPGLLSPEQTAALLARRDHALRRRVGAAAVDDEPDPTELAAYEQIAAARRRLSAMVSAYAIAHGRPHAAVHTELRRRTGGPPTAQASLEQIEARIDALQRL